MILGNTGKSDKIVTYKLMQYAEIALNLFYYMEDISRQAHYLYEAYNLTYITYYLIKAKLYIFL